MDNVINFENAKSTQIRKHTSKFEYLAECKNVLERQDYVDVLASIMDVEIYNELEPVLRMIVDNYYEIENFDD